MLTGEKRSLSAIIEESGRMAGALFRTDGNISALLMINSDIGLDTVSCCLLKGYIDYYE
jgi:hypothetical protein